MIVRLLLLAALAGGAIALVLVFAYTPTTTVHIHNDTRRQVTLSVCGSDPQTAGPGATVNVDPNKNDGHAACAVYEGTSDRAAGCLYIPTTRFGSGTTAQVSDSVRGVPADNCGD
jgi:hypothetical protein